MCPSRLWRQERVVALALSLTHNIWQRQPLPQRKPQNVPDVVQQFSVQCRIAASMAEMAACQAQMLQELADDLNRELAYFISENDCGNPPRAEIDAEHFSGEPAGTRNPACPGPARPFAPKQ